MTMMLQEDVTLNIEAYENYGSAYLDKPDTKWRGVNLLIVLTITKFNLSLVVGRASSIIYEYQNGLTVFKTFQRTIHVRYLASQCVSA